MTNNTARLTISPDVIQMLGRKLYSSHPLPIVVRELLQNSVDACKRYKVDPDIKIQIIESTNDKSIEVICTDNGEGMTESVLLNKFLALGESGKRDKKGGTGGFGIAKAAIMSNSFWSVHTHDMYVDVNRLGKPPKKVKYGEGTEVKVRINETFHESTIRRAIMMVYFSDVSVHLIYRRDDVTIIDDKIAGLSHLIDVESVRDFADTNKRFSIDLLKKFRIGNLPFDVSCKNVYRLNGLVQFMRDGSSNRSVNAIIDLYTDCLPIDNDYPLSMSRENIKSDVQWIIRSKLQDYDENPLTTQSTITTAILGDEKNFKSNKGSQLAGELINDSANYGGGQADDNSDCVFAANVPALGKLQWITVFRDQDDKPTTEEKRILRLWATILALTADASETFGVGITGEVNVNAQKSYENGTDYYLLNTGNMLDEDHQTMDALIHRLHMLACHEVTHYHQSGHNEHFTSMMGSIYSQTIGGVLENMPKLRSIIRANYK